MEKIVSEADEVVDYPLRQMAANLMRIARGAGTPAHVLGQIAGCLKSFEKYRELTGHWPSAAEIARILRIESKVDLLPVEIPDDQLALAMADDAICRGALQIAASRLLGQTIQERAGESEMAAGAKDRIEAMTLRRQAASLRTK